MTISDVIRGSLGRLVNIQSKYKSSSLVVSLLIGQLTTLKAALDQITEWVAPSLVNLPQHQQLVADLDISLKSCEIVVSILEERIAQLQWDDENDLKFKGKVMFLWEESRLNEFMDHLNNQTNALNLFLTALNWYVPEIGSIWIILIKPSRTAFEQNSLLQNNQSRQIIKQVENSSKSLLCLKDSESYRSEVTNTTEDTLLLDTEFEFDHEVVSTSVYRAAQRSHLRSAISKGKGKTPVPAAKIAAVSGSTERFSRAIPENPPQLQVESYPNTTTSQDQTFSAPVQPSTFGRLFNNDGIIYQTTEIDRFSSRLSRISSMLGRADNASIYSLESRINSDDRASQKSESSIKPWPLFRNAEREAQKEPKRTIKRFRAFQAPKTSTALDASKSEDVPVLISPGIQRHSEKKMFNVLMTGINNSGKSTLVKSIEAMAKGGWSIVDRLDFQEVIFANMVQNMKDILQAMGTLGIALHDEERRRVHVKAIFDHDSKIFSKLLAPEVWEAIEVLWNDSGVREAFERSSEYQLQDAAA